MICIAKYFAQRIQSFGFAKHQDAGPFSKGHEVTIFDLLFIVCVIAAAISLLRALYHACRKQWAQAARVLRRLGYGILAYATVLVVVSLTSRPRILKMGEKLRFDEWCISVERARLQPRIGEPPATAQAHGIFNLITVRVSNEARRRAQRARDAAVWLVDSRGNRYDPSAEAQTALDAIGASGPSLTSMMLPGSSFERTVVFDVSKDASDLRLGMYHGYFPGVVIIGASQSFLHPPTLVELTYESGP
jgi:hypothetical protein